MLISFSYVRVLLEATECLIHLILKVFLKLICSCLSSSDVSTDGIWCYIILWVTPRSSSNVVRWINLKERLLSICPPVVPSFYLYQPSPCSSSSPVYLLKFCSLDRKGLLHGINNCLFYCCCFVESFFGIMTLVIFFLDVTHVLDELEHTIQRVKVTTTPDGCVLDLFFITDNL